MKDIADNLRIYQAIAGGVSLLLVNIADRLSGIPRGLQLTSIFLDACALGGVYFVSLSFIQLVEYRKGLTRPAVYLDLIPATRFVRIIAIAFAVPAYVALSQLAASIDLFSSRNGSLIALFLFGYIGLWFSICALLRLVELCFKIKPPADLTARGIIALRAILLISVLVVLWALLLHVPRA